MIPVHPFQLRPFQGSGVCSCPHLPVEHVVQMGQSGVAQQSRAEPRVRGPRSSLGRVIQGVHSLEVLYCEDLSNLVCGAMAGMSSKVPSKPIHSVIQ